MKEREPVLYSACLLGIHCAHGGGHRAHRLPPGLPGDSVRAVPVCPEQLGGLPTPRAPAEIVGGSGGDALAGNARMVSRRGIDVTRAFLRGAAETVRWARAAGCTRAVMTPGSPSCGSRWHYDGSFSGRRVEGPGVTAAALEAAGIVVREPQEEMEAAGKKDCR